MYGPEWRNMTNYCSTLANYVHPYYIYPRMSSMAKFDLASYGQLWQSKAGLAKCGKYGQVCHTMIKHMSLMIQYGKLWLTMTKHFQLRPIVTSYGQI